MTEEQAKFFEEALDHDGVTPVEIRDDYSGRGMYGKTTYAVVVDSACDLIPSLLRHAAHNYVEVVAEGIFDDFELRQDDMGLGIVLY
jgi:hypothetical protein